ncbi:peroxisome assembly protein 26 isoform X2 [Polyodon spathula]|uniref:peroxisome assembly protein 26 isoform X2 n=1 Tax=Polyodon spathula TaxID=7913 RepID=UPI001B7F6AED|nr:peroxisome assembly protein 26 isoform X2 [Polyodon spathula]
MTKRLGSVQAGSSPVLFQGSAQALCLLDTATELLMVQRDFRAALETCERGLESVAGLPEQDDLCSFRYGEVKAALCIIGVQALAELNKWRVVLEWVLQYYGAPEKMSAKIMQMCILLYTKVEESSIILESGGDWLKSPVNQSLPGFGTVAELYLLHVLIPLGRFTEAELLAGNSVAFSEEQRRLALEIIECKREESRPRSPPESSWGEDITNRTEPNPVTQRFLVMVRSLHRILLVARKGLCSFPFQRVALAAILLYLLLVRTDPTIPSAFPWISSLLQMFRQMWDAMFAPYYRANISH